MTNITVLKQQDAIGMSNTFCASEKTLAEEFVEQHYLFRRNQLRGMVEFKKLEIDGSCYRPLTDEAFNSIVLAAKHEMGEDADIKSDLKLFVNSEDIPEYDPIEDWLKNLSEWDGKDRIVPYWSRIPGLTAEQIYWLSIWHRYVVAQWLGLSLEHGNECVPLLIGDQGCGKSTFWVRFLPPHLREYYLDHFNLDNKFDKEMALTNCPLICLDEMDQYSPRQVVQLKQALSKVKVTGRRIYGRTIDDRRRYASFVGTTNNRHPLTDSTGSRRYISIEIPKGQYIDNDTEIEYDQLFAQILHELREDGARYWFTNDETRQIQISNARYEQQLDLEQMISLYYKAPTEKSEKKAVAISTADIRQRLMEDFPNVPEKNFSSEKIGRKMTAMEFPKRKTDHGVFYSVIPRKTA